MPKESKPQPGSVELTKNIRGAMRAEQLESVFEAAGASRIEGQATEVLGETTAAQVAPLLSQGRFEAQAGAAEPDAELVKAARAAFEPSKLETVFEAEGIDNEKGQQTLAREMARIAQSATEFAEAEGRPVCHNCSAVGAARAAAQGSAPEMQP